MTPPLRLRGFEDWRRQARRRLPRGLFEYIDRGVGREVSLRHQRDRLDAVKITPRMLGGDRPVTLGTSLFGQPCAAPLAVAPTAMAGLVAHDGEVAMARAATRLGLPVCLSTQSINSVQQIRDAVPEARLWFQLYAWEDRALTRELLGRVRASGAEVLVVTVDTPTGARKDWNIRNGFDMPFTWHFRALLDVALHAPWVMRVILPYLARGGFPALGNYRPDLRPTLVRAVPDKAVRLRMALSWSDIAEIRSEWAGTMLLKGICHPQDAIRAADSGMDGIVVSSHGARNFDPCPAAIDLLPPIAEAVRGRMTILADSGVQTGTDVLKYLHAGASGVLAGRLPLWGLAAKGEAGAETALAGLMQELEEALRMSGLRMTDLADGGC
ncbi:alpha-hydroxy-acid oxidizing enzyme [Salipiger pallidus]|uniref:Alpha-hydroxy-acid oxidizing enzyme n=1 Tax=Salipiger pallidus TaxID=1775170 RepID=A0A8J3EFF0_9RHOB|nr:alpha-hydroxy acid oxidase [Salipiger pallidus]GGG64981.1 alpha-hydroxy-acid oxidizing enzyme [Salipiger pallidus]